MPAKNDKIHTLYDDATLERMKHYFKLADNADNDELLKYIKLYGMRRHIDLLEES